MALIDKKASAERVAIPHEEGAWVDLAPLTFGDQRRIAKSAEEGALSAAVAMIRAVLVAWSYPEPLNDETINDLDSKTVDWLANEVARRAKEQTK